MSEIRNNAAPKTGAARHAVTDSDASSPLSSPNPRNAPEPVAAPPPEVAPYVEALSPERWEQTKAQYSKDVDKAFQEIAGAFGVPTALIEPGAPEHPVRAIGIALLNLSLQERQDISREHPLESVNFAGLIVGELVGDGADAADAYECVSAEFLAPEVLSAFKWRSEYTPQDLARISGHELILN